MLNNRLLRRTAHFISRGGFTLVELLVVIAIIAILAGVALGPITAGIKKAQQSGAVQTTKSLQLGEFQYASDNSNVYPYGTPIGTFIGTMYPTYISDLGTLVVNGAPNVSKYTGSAPATGLDKTTDSYDFSYLTTTTAGGITSAVPDDTPVVFTGVATALSITSAGSTTTPINVTCDAGSAFGTAGMAVCYKGGSAKFITSGSGGAAVNTVNIVDPGYPAGYTINSFGGW